MPTKPSISLSQIGAISLETGVVFATLRGGPLHGQAWSLSTEDGEDLLFHVDDLHTGTPYCVECRKNSIVALGIWEYVFFEMYPYLKDEENDDPRGLYGRDE